jgi:fructokinase
VNLRPPFDRREVLEPLLRQARLVKMNEHELAAIASWHSISGEDEARAQALLAEYSWETLCITRGGEGAWLFHEGQFHRQAAFPITVKDTIGSGDSFLAALLQQLLSGQAAEKALRFACAVGAYVATQQGATPALNPKHIEELFAI